MCVCAIRRRGRYSAIRSIYGCSPVPSGRIAAPFFRSGRFACRLPLRPGAPAFAGAQYYNYLRRWPLIAARRIPAPLPGSADYCIRFGPGQAGRQAGFIIPRCFAGFASLAPAPLVRRSGSRCRHRQHRCFRAAAALGASRRAGFAALPACLPTGTGTAAGHRAGRGGRALPGTGHGPGPGIPGTSACHIRLAAGLLPGRSACRQFQAGPFAN